MSAASVFVDESKAKDYLLIAAAIVPRHIAESRRAVRTLLLPGQPRLHMKQENESRKRLLLDTFATLDTTVTIFRAPRDLGSEVVRRRRCLEELVGTIGPAGGRLCLERDETLVARDKQCMIEATRRTGSVGTLEYWHESAASEPLLAIPDAVGWAWARGGDWRRRAQSMISDVIDITP
ncbi:hypothetical protein [Rathayibacter sp. VKM Ac-2927]|uniref:hypothetical protein n=1 Tax=Rathayibacter sp. VKM Ac-2927 TaxID=2929478 RepID=UPI001FB4885E|nr:hypothetical protein [Rathayibacter sp. VKM Ac-2927]MCJ1688509.1 hypothetical protein [Rathayibacter sp. VKM Ac-2927]